MEKELADIERQKVTLKLAQERLAFNRTEAIRLNDEAIRIVHEAELAVRTEQHKLIQLEQVVTAINIATMFDTNSKVILLNPIGIPKKSYTTRTKAGEPIRFTIKQIAYPLDIKDNRICGLLEPRVDQRVQTVKGGYLQRGDEFLRQLTPSTILETDVYELISKMKFIKRGSIAVFPIQTPYTPDGDSTNFDIKFDEYSGSIVLNGKYTQIGYYKYRIDKFTHGYLVFHVAQRTDLDRKRKITGKTKEDEEE